MVLFRPCAGLTEPALPCWERIWSPFPISSSHPLVGQLHDSLVWSRGSVVSVFCLSLSMSPSLHNQHTELYTYINAPNLLRRNIRPIYPPFTFSYPCQLCSCHADFQTLALPQSSCPLVTTWWEPCLASPSIAPMTASVSSPTICIISPSSHSTLSFLVHLSSLLTTTTTSCALAMIHTFSIAPLEICS